MIGHYGDFGTMQQATAFQPQSPVRVGGEGKCGILSGSWRTTSAVLTPMLPVEPQT